MEANELRIGNFVSYNSNHKELGTVTAISKEMFKESDMIYLNSRIDKYYKIIDINPIPLTEEWLVNFGFVDTDWAGGFYYRAGLFWNADDKEIGFEKQWFPNKCLYVHQLQNLYFALTQTELIIK